jgi:glycosyltransferase involved in cell wall biosynthesis
MNETHTPAVAVIIGSYNRPGRARTFLACLVDQEFTDWEAILTDNSDDPECRRKIEELCKIDPRVRYEWTHDQALTNFPRVSIPSLYDAAEIGVKMTTGKWLWFPNEDTYACPYFLQRMVQFAEENDLEFAYCEFVQGRPDMPYFGFFTRAEACQIDKTCYMIRRDWFPESWPGKIEMYGVADGLLVNDLVAKGIRHGKFNQMMVVHN